MEGMEERPLELDRKDEEPGLSVWKRRILFVLMIGLCVAFAAPMTFCVAAPRCDPQPWRAWWRYCPCSAR